MQKVEYFRNSIIESYQRINFLSSFGEFIDARQYLE